MEERHSFSKSKIAGPIFNGYDNGGYLIYYLYPERVFVDNRPEAYPKEFFTNVYIPMQEKETEWQKQDDYFKFNSIFFYRDDQWAQDFLSRRLADKNWAQVYADEKFLILVKRNQQNQQIIKRFEDDSRKFLFRRGT